MKVLFLYSVQLSLFCAYTCILGIPQPRHSSVSSSKGSYGENVFKKCHEVEGDIGKNNFLDPNVLLCFGLKVFSEPSPGAFETSTIFDGVEQLSNTDICKYFQEMRLNSTQGNLSESAVIYNRQFRDKNTCERACLDVMENVNPLCSIILFLSRTSKGNPIGSGNQAPSVTLPSAIMENDDNEVPDQSKTYMKDFPNKSTNQQKPKKIDVGLVTGQQITLDGESKHLVQNTENNLQKQTPQELKSSPDDLDNLQEHAQQSVAVHIGSAKEKPKATIEEQTPVSERVDQEPATSGLPENKVHIPPNNSTVPDASKKTTDSKKTPKESIVDDTNSVTKTENKEKSDTSEGQNMEMSSVVLPGSSDNDKNDQVTATKPNVQEIISIVEERVTSKKELPDRGLQNKESISQVATDTVDNQKLLAGNKKTENPPQKETELQTDSKTITEVISKSNIDGQKPSQNSEKAYTNENTETAPQFDTDNTQKTASEEIHITDTGDGVAELDTHFSVDDGESNVNTGFTSGGGTGADYGRPASDVLETDKNDINRGTFMFNEKYDDDDDSHFFAYFMTLMVFCIVGYLLFHNKQKILALALEGRVRRGRRRPNTSGYRKLDSNLEEAISSSKSASVTQVIY